VAERLHGGKDLPRAVKTCPMRVQRKRPAEGGKDLPNAYGGKDLPWVVKTNPSLHGGKDLPRAVKTCPMRTAVKTCRGCTASENRLWLSKRQRKERQRTTHHGEEKSAQRP
jgi:hypothetical protein